MPEYGDILKGKHIILTENGVYEPRYALRYKGTIDDQLQSHINNRPISIMNVAEMDGAHNISLSCYSNTDSGDMFYYTSCRLKKIRINTTYDVVHSKDYTADSEEPHYKWLSPTFNNGEDRNAQTYTMDWVVPLNLELYITFEGSWIGSDFRIIQCYFHCRIDPTVSREELPERAKGWFLLPTGNVYEDGRLCFGPGFERGRSIIETTKKNIDLFYATPWNSDLLADRDKTVRMFRFNETDNTQMDPLGKPYELMRSFSNGILDRLPITKSPNTYRR